MPKPASNYAITIYVESGTQSVTLSDGKTYQKPGQYPTTPLTNALITDFANLGNGNAPIYIRLQNSWKSIQPFAPNMPTKGTGTGQLTDSPRPTAGTGNYDGTYDWTFMDNIVNTVLPATSGKVLLLWPIEDAPDWLKTVDSAGNTGATPPVNLDGTFNASGTGQLPNATDMANFCNIASARYKNKIGIYQIGNEEWDTQNRDGGPLGIVAAAAYPKIRANASNAIIGVCSVRKVPQANKDTGNSSLHVISWINNFFAAGGVTDFIDFHYYRDGTVDALGNQQPDPTIAIPDARSTTNIPKPSQVPSVGQEIQLIQGLIAANNSSAFVVALECGWVSPYNPGTTGGVPNPFESYDQQAAYTVDGNSGSTNITTGGMMSVFRDTAGSPGICGVFTMDARLGNRNIVEPASGGNAAVYHPAYAQWQKFIAANPSWPAVTLPQGIAISPNPLTLTGTSGGTNPTNTLSVINTSNATQAFSISNISTSWLSFTPTTANVTAGNTITLTATGAMGTKTPGTYSATATFNMGSASTTMNVNMTINAAGSGTFSVSPTTASFADTVGGSGPATQSVVLSYTGASTAFSTGTITYGSGATGWLAASPTSGNVSSTSSKTITLTATTGSLAVGTYTATVPFTLGSQTASVTCTFKVSAASGTAGISEDTTTITFNGTTSVNPGSGATVTITNTSTGNESWTAVPDVTWLSVSSGSGTFASNGTAAITITATSVGLTVAGSPYVGHVVFTGTVNGGSTASVTCTITLNVTAAAIPGLHVDQTTMSFTGTANSSNAAAQTLTLSNTGTTAEPWTVAVDTPAWLSVTPTSGNFLNPGDTQALTVVCNNLAAKLIPGTYVGHITFTSAHGGVVGTDYVIRPLGGTLIIYSHSTGSATAQTAVTLTVNPKPLPPTIGSNTATSFVSNKKLIISKSLGG